MRTGQGILYIGKRWNKWPTFTSRPSFTKKRSPLCNIQTHAKQKCISLCFRAVVSYILIPTGGGGRGGDRKRKTCILSFSILSQIYITGITTLDHTTIRLTVWLYWLYAFSHYKTKWNFALDWYRQNSKQFDILRWDYGKKSRDCWEWRLLRLTTLCLPFCLLQAPSGLRQISPKRFQLENVFARFLPHVFTQAEPIDNLKAIQLSTQEIEMT